MIRTMFHPLTHTSTGQPKHLASKQTLPWLVQQTNSPKQPTPTTG